MSLDAELRCRPIGVVHSPFTERVQVPRQPSIARHVKGTIELFEGRNFEHAVEDLESWRFIWVLFWFHLNSDWRPKVLPPRSDRRRGVFATRSPHRPNPIGMSVVELESIDGLMLYIRGVDMLDDTPVLDIKPYVPYADAVDSDAGGWLEQPKEAPRYTVEFASPAQAAVEYLRSRWKLELGRELAELLEVDPKPHPYRRIKPQGRGFVLAFKEWRAHFEIDGSTVRVTRIESGYRARDLRDESNPALDRHRAFLRQIFS